MIYSVRGTLTHVEMNLAVIECAGVGYAVRTSAYTMSKLPQMEAKWKLYTYLHISEAAADLFGFFDPGELSCFKQLLSVSRVGPKVALSVLSTVTPEQFAFCVASGDAKTIAKAPGLDLPSKRPPSRILLELKDKISKEQLSGALPETFSRPPRPTPEKPSARWWWCLGTAKATRQPRFPSWIRIRRWTK